MAGAAGEMRVCDCETNSLAWGMFVRARDVPCRERSQALYVQTGSALWARATEAERRGVIEAFAANTRVLQVEMVNACINDALVQVESVLELSGVGSWLMAWTSCSLHRFDSVRRRCGQRCSRPTRP